MADENPAGKHQQHTTSGQGTIGAATGFVVYDDQCRLCTAWMHFVLRHNRAHKLLFVPVGSWVGSRLLAAAGMTTRNYASMVYAQAPHIYQRSDAIIRILYALGGPWRLARVLLVLPASWRDRVYALVARNRYRWFGNCGGCACGVLHRPKQYLGHHVI